VSTATQNVGVGQEAEVGSPSRGSIDTGFDQTSGGAAPVVRPKVLVATTPTRSRTWTLKALGPGVVGIPEISPSVARVSPAGRLPEASDHRSGRSPPVAARVAA
jgi:hypothetical protein